MAEPLPTALRRWCMAAAAACLLPLLLQLPPGLALALAAMAGLPWSTPWLAVSLALYGMAGACWLPVVWLQLRMRDMAAQAAQGGGALPPLYWRYARWWEALGYPAFVAMAVVFYLMVNKPALGV